MRTPRASLLMAVGALLTGVLIMVSSRVAHASCAGPPEPSPYEFTGTVIDTAEEGRVATVVTDAGRQVEVLGTQDTSWFTNSYSSVDRRYALGARYEFHPLNDETPYRDNACTATTHLAGPELAPTEASAEYLPAWLLVDEQAGPVGYLLFAAAAAVPAAVVAGALQLRRRTRRASPDV
jgi:hypothetical protein